MSTVAKERQREAPIIIISVSNAYAPLHEGGRMNPSNVSAVKALKIMTIMRGSDAEFTAATCAIDWAVMIVHTASCTAVLAVLRNVPPRVRTRIARKTYTRTTHPARTARKIKRLLNLPQVSLTFGHDPHDPSLERKCPRAHAPQRNDPVR